MESTRPKFLIVSEFAELLDLAIYLQEVENQEVLMHIPNKDYSKIGDGIVEKTDDSMIQIGKGYTWIFDGCTRGKRQDWLRAHGELVVGGTEKSDFLENDRQAGQEWFKEAGFIQPESHNFKSFEEASSFVKKNSDRRWILKQNGDAPKSLNHMGKFDDSSDMLFHLDELKKNWNTSAMGEIDFDLMQIVEGTEMAASGFFNGSDWLRDAQGRVVGYLNFEEKKEIDGGLGETTGEMGTTFIGVNEDNALFKDILLRDKITSVLKNIGYKGVFDINCIKTKEGIVALEPTCRPGIPATSYEFMEGMKTPIHEVLTAMALGKKTPIEVHLGVGMVMVVAGKPFPVEADLEKEATSLGEKLWILDNKKPAKEFTDEQRKHIHLENFEKVDNDYRVATKNGYLLTVTGREGKTISEVRENLIEYIKNNIYLAGMKFRSDIGERVEGKTGTKTEKLRQDYEEKLKTIESNKAQEMSLIKKTLAEKIYG